MLRRSDLSYCLRLAGPTLDEDASEALLPFQGKTPVAFAAWSGAEQDPITLQFAGEKPAAYALEEVLTVLEAHTERLRERLATGGERERRRALRNAA